MPSAMPMFDGSAGVVRLAGLWMLLAVMAPAANAGQQRATVVQSPAGDNVIQLGWTHVRSQESNGAPRNELRSNALFPVLGVQESFRSEGVDIQVPNINTLAVIFQRYLTDRLALNLVAGWPRKASLQATGEVAPTGPTGSINNLNLADEQFGPTGRARLWAPALTLTWLFGSRDTPLRPFAGLGVSYIWFTEEKLNDNLATAINRQFGLPLALANGGTGETSTDSYVEADYAPVYVAGLSWRLSRDWQLDGSVSYVPFSTTAHVIVDDESGQELGRSRTRIDFDPFIFQFTLGYRY